MTSKLVDITVQLELTLPEGFDDQKLKSFLEHALEAELLRQRELHFYDRANFDWKETSIANVQWVDHGILGIDTSLIEVTGIVSGICNVTPWKDAIKSVEAEYWRVFERR